jgi:transposase
MKGFRQVETPREQMILWSHSLEDAVAPDHPVRLFDQILKSEAFAEVFKEWRQEYDLTTGRPPFSPQDLSGLYLYGMINRLRSSRQLEAACYNRLDVIWLMQGQTPDHSTIAAFVAKHEKHLKKLFRQSIHLSMSAGLVTLAHVSVDGTKLEADAGRNSVRTQAWMEAESARLELAAAELEKEWAANEEREKVLWSEQSPQSGPQNSERRAAFEKKQAKLKAALAAIKQRAATAQAEGGEPPKPIASLNDPEARVMPDKQGKSKPGYNAQIAVDSEAGIIVAQDLNDRPEDVGQLTPMLEEVKEQTGRLPDEASADSGYNSGGELAQLETMGVTSYLPDAGKNSGAVGNHREPTEAEVARADALAAAHAGATLSEEQWKALPRTQKKIDKCAFTYQTESDTYRCPAGISLPVLRHSSDQKSWGTAHRYQYGGSPACATCAHAADCCTNPAKGRTVNRDQFEPQRQRMRDRMATPEGQARYRLRAQTVEPRFGVIKGALGIRRLMRRGLAKAATEFALICTALNFQVMFGHWSKVAPVLNLA